MGQLIAGQADLALFPLTLTARRAQYIQHTTPYMDDGYAILVHVNEHDPGETH
jgi:ABC-type amino acid transport substrate-binding protein